ncbi:MAG TPA: IS3 family transposase, partial [Propioniciclava sp.]|uniref:IS3 family transposase n=1 Tax=Propioniciclava sp. TaxID=2038686 RepID=UPI002CF41892
WVTPASTTLPRSMLGVSQSFFALLQKNVLDRRSWSTREELRLAIVSWIEGKYHRKRRQRRLGKLTPVEFELIMKPTATLAA